MGYNYLQNLGENAGISTFRERKEDINRKGRTPNLAKKIQEQLGNATEMFIPKSEIIRETDKGIYIKSTTSQQLAKKLIQLAKSKRDRTSLKAMELILSKIDTKEIIFLEEESRTLLPSESAYTIDLHEVSTATLKAMVDIETNGNTAVENLPCEMLREFVSLMKPLDIK